MQSLIRAITGVCAATALLTGCFAGPEEELRASADIDEASSAEALSSCSQMRCRRLPASQTIADPSFRPEGLAIDPLRGTLLVGSLRDGGLYRVVGSKTVRFAAHRERDEAFWVDHRLGSVGIHVDRKHQRVLVAATRREIIEGVKPGYVDPSLAQLTGVQAGLVAYDLRTRRQLFFADFTPLRTGLAVFANDVTVDADGNAYVTDSVGAAVLKVDLHGNATSFASSPLFKNPVFGPNGIDYDPAGYLMVGISGTGSIARVSLANPTDITAVNLPSLFIIDGLTRTEQGQWVAVGFEPALDANGNPDPTKLLPMVARFTTNDGWQSASVRKIALDQPATTGEACGTDFFVSFLNTSGPDLPTELRRLDLSSILE